MPRRAIKRKKVGVPKEPVLECGQSAAKTKKRNNVLVDKVCQGDDDYVEAIVKVNFETIDQELNELAGKEPVEVEEFWNRILAVAAQSSLSMLSPGESRDHGRQIKILTSVAAIVAFAIKQNQPTVHPYLRVILEPLKQALPTLQGLDMKSADGVSVAFESWFQRHLPDANSLSVNAFLYLLNKVISKGATRKHVKRMADLSGLMADLDLQSLPLKDLLLKSVRCWSVVKTREGSKFVQDLLLVSPVFTPQVHQSVKQILPGAPDNVASTFGDIYLKAWKVSEGATRSSIEDAIQDLMQRSIVAKRLAKGQSIYQPCLKLLHRFQVHKNDRKVQAMVYTLYAPILWRQPRSADYQVRANAAGLLLDAFPIEDPSLNMEQKAEGHEKQLKIMVDLLTDDYPEVRIVAVEGVCRVMALYWLVLSSVQLNQLFRIMVTELSFDSSSHLVRATVIAGLNHILKTCPRSHVYLKQVLPKISLCLFDVKDVVRSTFMDLMLTIRDLKIIQFWNVVDVHDILAQLEVETSSTVCEKIVKLLLRSFFPTEGEYADVEESKIERCIYLIKTNRNASRKFYLYCDKMCKLHDWVKFMLTVLVTLKRFVKKTLKENESRCDDDKENSFQTSGYKRKLFNVQQPFEFVMDADDDTIPMEDFVQVDKSTLLKSQSNLESFVDDNNFYEDLKIPGVVAGLMDIVCVVWMTRNSEIAQPDNAEYRSLMEKKASHILFYLLKHYKTSEVCRPLVYLSSILPPTAARNAAGFCLSKIRNFIPQEENAQVKVGPEFFDRQWAGRDGQVLFMPDDPMTTYVDSLCNWKQGDTLLEMVTEWIRKDISHREKRIHVTVANRSSKKKGVTFDDSLELHKTSFAFRIAKYVIRHPVNRATLLRKQVTSVLELVNTLRGYLALAETMLAKEQDEHTSSSSLEDCQMIGEAWQLMLKIPILVLTVNKQCSGLVIAMFDWANRVLIKAKSSLLKTQMINFCANGVVTLLSADLLDKNGVALVANACAHLTKQVAVDKPWENQCVAILVPMSRVMVQMSVIDSAHTTYTTTLLKHIVRFLSVVKDFKQQANDKDVVNSIKSIKNNVSTAVKTSKELALFNPIFKIIKKNIVLRIMNQNFDDWLSEVDEKGTGSVLEMMLKVLSVKKTILRSFLDKLSIDTAAHIELDLVILRILAKQNPSKADSFEFLLAKIESRLKGKEVASDTKERIDDHVEKLKSTH